MYRRYEYGLLALIILAFVSCKKQHNASPTPPPSTPVKRILLSDIVLPGLPSPYYHFEYGPDSLVTKADFASGFTMYDVLYNGGRITEMRNNIIVNHDTLRYVYDDAGKMAMLGFINQSNIMYRHVFFAYDGDRIKQIQWDHKEGNTGFLIDRTLSFTFYPDGNVKTITDRRPPVPGAGEFLSVKTFDGYDEMINVDDFTLIHDGIHDHLFLLQGFRLQRNNPRIEKLSVNGTDLYSIDYTYFYNNDHTPSRKAGDLLYLSGSSAGQRFNTNCIYTYYH